MIYEAINNNNLVDSTFKEVLDVIKPSREHWVTRFNVINEIKDVVSSIDNLRGATVEPFGSFLANLFSRWGDLNISIELPNEAYISICGNPRRLDLLEEMFIALSQKGCFRKLRMTSIGRLPILKFESIHHRIHCELSVDNFPGQIKSKFLFWISEIDMRFRDLVLLVKEWAQAHNISNTKRWSLNSYSLCLLVIFHFQTCVPPIFPPLKYLYPGNITDDLKGVRADVEKNIKETCAANIAQFRSDKHRRFNCSSLQELLISFLGKFSEIEWIMQDFGISTFNGKWEEIKKNPRWLPKSSTAFIEDPFEQPENTARGLSVRHMKHIAEAFKSTHYCIISRSRNKTAILDALVGPQVSQSILMPHVPYMDPLSVPRISYLSGQMTREPKYTSQGNRAKNSTTSSKKKKIQEKKIWIPKSKANV
ncbi:hypothetical protein ACFE04_000515 [Oxalis oulophora]